MIITIIYTASECTIYTKAESKKRLFKEQLGFCQANLDAKHHSRELHWVEHKLNRLGYHDKKKNKKILEKVSESLRTNNPFDMELYHKG